MNEKKKRAVNGLRRCAEHKKWPWGRGKLNDGGTKEKVFDAK
jgi:hypothetical protein